jgi:prepilin-type processing-associated H-X9-DG protein
MANGRTTSVIPETLARADYAANAGSQGFNQISAGPPSLAEADSPNYPWPDTSECSGIVFLRSAVSLLDVTCGSSNTFLVGERYINSDHYFDDRDLADNEAMYVGFDDDVYRVTANPPRRDRAGLEDLRSFGSAHAAGLNMLYCDGSVRLIGYDVDPHIFFLAGRRSED